MKKAHIYKLHVKWNEGEDWDVDILSITAEAVAFWLPKIEMDQYPVCVSITLIKRDAEVVHENFQTRWDGILSTSTIHKNESGETTVTRKAKII